MVEDLKIFESPEFGVLRVVMIDGEPWFVGKDVTEIIGYKNASGAIKGHVEEGNRKMAEIPSEVNPAKKHTMIAVNKDGFMKLLLTGKLPSANVFKEWVEKDVLPILESQDEMPGNRCADDLEEYISTLEDILENERLENNRLSACLNELPTTIFKDSVSERSVPLALFCNTISELIPEFAASDVRAWLRSNGYLSCTNGSTWWCPIYKYVKEGLFEVLNGKTVRSTYVTEYGKQYFAKSILDDQMTKSVSPNQTRLDKKTAS